MSLYFVSLQTDQQNVSVREYCVHFPDADCFVFGFFFTAASEHTFCSEVIKFQVLVANVLQGKIENRSKLRAMCRTNQFTPSLIYLLQLVTTAMKLLAGQERRIRINTSPGEESK